MQYIDIFSIFDSIPDQYRTQEIRGFVVSLNSFLIIFCPDKYITQKMCDKVVDNSLALPKFFSIGSLQVKVLKKNYTAL